MIGGSVFHLVGRRSSVVGRRFLVWSMRAVVGGSLVMWSVVGFYFRK